MRTAAARATYDPTAFQPALYCAESFDAMVQAVRDHLLPRA